jgi:3',5'-nucleoside bisphosphate phosphatase
MKKILLAAWMLLILVTLQSFSQNLNNIQLEHMRQQSVRKEINLPDILGYTTLKGDFHMHSVFSDGIVWPTLRVDEAWQEGLDAIAITEHIEHRPHREFVKGDHNSPYEIALPRAQQLDIILIRSGEITRSMPPGHLIAMFLDDLNALETPDVIDALQVAADQGAFIFWCHPGWKAQQPDTTLWMQEHQNILDKGLMHGIEVFNEKEWYPIALDWGLKKDLAILGFSDIHAVTSHYYDLTNGHRPMTLIFAKDRSEEAIKDAMFNGRTVAWFDNKLAGKEEYLRAIFDASVTFKDTGHEQRGKKLVKVQNHFAIPFFVTDNEGNSTILPAEKEIVVPIQAGTTSFEVTNLFIRSQENLKVKVNL